MSVNIIRIKKKYNAKLYLLLKEYWPQDPVDLGAMKAEGVIYKYFRFIEEKMLRNVDYIGTCSPAGIKYVIDRYSGLDNKLEICPHCQKPINVDKNAREKIRLKYGIPTDKCVFVYGGNLGVSQGIDDMIKCISHALQVDGSYFLIVGSGVMYNKVVDAFSIYDNTKIKVMSNISANDYIELINACDVGLLFLFKDYKVPNIPAKFISYLNTELPIIAAVDRTTDVGDIIEYNNCGIQLINGDVEKFTEAVLKMMNSETRIDMGRNSKKLLLNEYTPKKCYDIIMKHFH